jgi:O-antigen/teichoic acid export membrane protein
MLNRLLVIWAAFSILSLIMYFIAPWVYKTWLNDKLVVPGILNFSMMLWVIFTTLLTIYGTFLSGVGKLRLSLYHAIFVMVLNIPLSIYLAGFEELGSAGVILASLIGTLFRFLFQPVQTYKIINGTARGIWRR